MRCSNPRHRNRRLSDMSRRRSASGQCCVIQGRRRTVVGDNRRDALRETGLLTGGSTGLDVEVLEGHQILDLLLHAVGGAVEEHHVARAVFGHVTD